MKEKELLKAALETGNPEILKLVKDQLKDDRNRITPLWRESQFRIRKPPYKRP